MNAKLAKRLRKQAQLKTSSNPETIYNPKGTPPRYYNINMEVTKLSKGIPQKLDLSCTRGYYKSLKKRHKA